MDNLKSSMQHKLVNKVILDQLQNPELDKKARWDISKEEFKIKHARSDELKRIEKTIKAQKSRSNKYKNSLTIYST